MFHVCLVITVSDVIPKCCRFINILLLQLTHASSHLHLIYSPANAMDKKAVTTGGQERPRTVVQLVKVC